MSKIYLHIGMPKTGTSSLQSFLGMNRILLREKGIDFPSGEDYIMLRGIPEVHNGVWIRSSYNSAEFAIWCDRMFKRCQKSPVMLFSDEGLFHLYVKSRDMIRELARRTTKAGHSLEIIIYLRRQDEFFMSDWAQVVKIRSPLTFSQWMEKRRSDGDEADYYTLLSNLSEDVGREHLHVRVYEKSRFTSGERTIFSDFMEILGVDDLTGCHYPEKMKNVSLQDVYLETKLRLNRDVRFQINKGVAEKEDEAWRMATEIKDVLVELQEKARAEGTLQNRKPMSSEQCAKLLEDYREINEKTAVRFLGMDPGTPLFTDPVKGEWEQASYTDEEVFEVMSQALLALEQRCMANRNRYDQLKERTRLKNLPAFTAGKLSRFVGGKKH